MHSSTKAKMRASDIIILILVLVCMTMFSFILYTNTALIEAMSLNKIEAVNVIQRDINNIRKIVTFQTPHEQPPLNLLNETAITPIKHTIEIYPPLEAKSICPNIDRVSYKKPLTKNDAQFRPSLAKADHGEEKYVTFELDQGGWNNIRMQMETVLVFAAATGRTLVMPPDQPMYLLDKGKGHQNEHHLADFFPFDEISRDNRVKVISMDEYLTKEAITGRLKVSSLSMETVFHADATSSVYTVNKTSPSPPGTVLFPPHNQSSFSGTDRNQRRAMWSYLRLTAACPKLEPFEHFVVIPNTPFANNTPSHKHFYFSNDTKQADRFNTFSAKRTAKIYDSDLQDEHVIHFISLPGAGYRLLTHFYTFIYFESLWMDLYYKRFVRDYVRYVDDIFCKASIIVDKLLASSNGLGYSSFHVRRGELQYKEVKIEAGELLKNIGDRIPRGQLVYIATDERNKTFFNPLKKRFPEIRFLDDYFDEVGLASINPNFLGMIDQVVASRGQIFVGTWFSTFTAYITRLRGYLGLSDYTVWYGDVNHRDRFQKPEIPKFPFYMREWKESWENIDE